MNNFTVITRVGVSGLHPRRKFWCFHFPKIIFSFRKIDFPYIKLKEFSNPPSPERKTFLSPISGTKSKGISGSFRRGVSGTKSAARSGERPHPERGGATKKSASFKNAYCRNRGCRNRGGVSISIPESDIYLAVV